MNIDFSLFSYAFFFSFLFSKIFGKFSFLNWLLLPLAEIRWLVCFSKSQRRQRIRSSGNFERNFYFDYPNRWYVHNPEFVLEKETHKLLWDFEIQMDHLILAGWPELVIVNKKKGLPNCGLSRSGWLQGHWRKTKREINTRTLLENWKNYRTGMWRWISTVT